MELCVVFNELSLRRPAPNPEEAREWMSHFIDVLKAANDAGLKTLRTHADFRELSLSPDYPISRWCNDRLVSREESEYLLTYATRFEVIRPHIAGLSPNHQVQQRNAMGFTGGYEGAEALGLGFAYLLDGIAISMLSEPAWDSATIEIDRMEGEIEDRVLVKHMSRKTHIRTHHDWIAACQVGLIKDGPSLVRYAASIYPNVVFCPRAIIQIEAMGANHYYFDMLRNEISNMQRYCSNWTHGPFNSDELGGRTNPESEATLQRFGSQRRFFIPGKGHQIFTWHTRLDQDWRIHFFPVPAERTLYIGYVGEHLRTAQG